MPSHDHIDDAIDSLEAGDACYILLAAWPGTHSYHRAWALYNREQLEAMKVEMGKLYARVEEALEESESGEAPESTITDTDP
jgi:hypothetical protein